MDVHSATHLLSFAGVCLFVFIIYKKINAILNGKIYEMKDKDEKMRKQLEETLLTISILEKKLSEIEESSEDIINQTQKQADEFVDQETHKLQEYYKNKESEVYELIENMKKNAISKTQKDIIGRIIDNLNPNDIHKEDIVRKS